MPKNIDTNNPSITIDLASSTGDYRRPKGQLIQSKAFETIMDQIHDSIHVAKFRREKKEDHGGLVFFIDGTRGAGKSTFLVSVVDALTNKDDPNPRHKLKTLMEIDPTKVETGEHIFVSLLHCLKTIIEEQLCIRHSSSNEEKYESWRKQLRGLAGGLQLLDSNHNPLGQIDEESFLDWGMERARSGVDFANRFKRLVETSCELLQVDALVIAIDDADTNFSKGKQILEIIRRYLDSSQLVTLMTGDLQMYSHLVRDLYFENMGKTIHHKDEHRDLERTKLVDHMEDQYLKKIFPIQHRVHLKPLWDLKNEINYYIDFGNDGAKKLPLMELINRLLGQGLHIKADSDRELYREFLLKQPLRSVIQLLLFCTQKMKSDEEAFKPERVADGFRAMLLGSLYSQQIDVDALSAGDMAAHIDAVFNVVIRDGEFDTGYYMRPQPSDESLRNCFVALAAEVARHCNQRPATAIQYMLQGPGSITIYNETVSRMGVQTDAEKQRLFKNYFSIGRHEDALNWAWHACQPLAGSSAITNTRSVKSGVIGLNVRAPDGQRALGRTADWIVKNSKMPAFAYSIVKVTSGGPKAYASIYNILGLAVRLLKIPTNNEEILKVSVNNELARLETAPTISGPQWDANITSSDDQPTKSDKNKETISDEINNSEELAAEGNADKLVKDTIQWLQFANSLNHKIKPSAVMMGKVWSRLYFGLFNCSEKQRSLPSGAATIMELYALCLINAFLVEEADHHIESKGNIKPLRSNPQTSPKIIIDKFRKFGNNNDQLDINEYPLTRIIGTCPFILGLIQVENTTEIYGRLKNDNSKTNMGCDKATFDKLNLAFIANTPNHIYDKRRKELTDGVGVNFL
jgi:hypothetical protein